jgi:hypothetical protein
MEFYAFFKHGVKHAIPKTTSFIHFLSIQKGKKIHSLNDSLKTLTHKKQLEK